MAEQKSELELSNGHQEITDRKTLGVIDASLIPSGYGIVGFNPENHEQLITNSTGTEFVHAIGTGNSPAHPIEIVVKSTQTYKDLSVVHLALAKAAQVRQTSIYATLNDIVFTYSPHGNQIEISAAAKFTAPRDFDALEKAIKASKPVWEVEMQYYRFRLENPNIFKDPIEWYRERKGTGIDVATAMFARVKARLEAEDL